MFEVLSQHMIAGSHRLFIVLLVLCVVLLVCWRILQCFAALRNFAQKSAQNALL
jgi:hypothetical protein